jgi:hypothetical protein
MAENYTVQSATMIRRNSSRKSHGSVPVLTKNFMLKCALIDVEGSS